MQLKESNYRKGCSCEHCRAARNAAQMKYRKLHPEFVKRNNLKSYGLTYEEWQQKVLDQDNKCAACGAHEVGHNQHGLMSLAVDHNHTTGKVRKLLCHRCNRALGLLGDDANRVQALADYRKQFEE